ncbi:MAG: hypothetical protein AAF600_06860 [Bacteroidota bacterium]
MKKTFKLFVFVLITVAFSACELMNEDVEPIVKMENDEGTIGGPGGGGNDPEEPE